MGMAAFRRRWGNRPEQDNWRWNDSQQIQQATVTGESGSGNLLGSPPVDKPLTAADSTVAENGATMTGWESDLLGDSTAFAEWIKQDLYTHIPEDQESLNAYREMIKSALAQNGEIYRFNLMDYPAGINSYQSLLERFPQDDQAASWYFNLYQLHQAGGQREAMVYRDKILGTYPQSIYSKIILDPNYLQEMEADKQRANELYERLYAQYVNGGFQEIIRMVGETAENAQLAYLKALAIGRTSPVEHFERSLQQIVSRFPDDSLVTPLVLQHLAFIAQNPTKFEGREYAIVGREGVSNKFLDEPGLTQWPQLVIKGSQQTRTQAPITGAASQSGISTNRVTDENPITTTQLDGNNTSLAGTQENPFRDISLLPDSATYFFVVHVMHPTVNLAPSRFGIGQFNRSRYPEASISHQLKRVNDESQLLYMGPFSTFQEAKIYEARFLPLIGEMMRIPAEVYHTFIVTESIFGTLSDFGKIDDYYHFYIAQ